MNVILDPAANNAPANEQPKPATAASRSNERPTVAAPAKPSASTSQPVTAPVAAQAANITFRRDSNGRIYYLIAAPSGQAIEEIPASSVRAVAQSIEDYLKQQETKDLKRVDVKG